MTKFSKRYKELILPAGLLSALIIGAGMFALPYVFREAGFLAGFLYLAVFAAVFSTVHLMYSEIIAGTPGRHRFVGYAEIYLGRAGKWLSVVAVLSGLLLTLTIYLILSVSFIKLVSPALPPVVGALLFWFMGSVVVAMSLSRVANFEFAVAAAMVVIVVVLFVLGLAKTDFRSLLLLAKPVRGFTSLLLPYGVVLFALAGRAAISSVRDYFDKNNLDISKLKPAIILGTVIPAVVYAIFVLAITWLSPGGVSMDAVSGIGLIAPWVLGLIGALGIFIIWTSYFFLGLEARDILRYDFKFPSAAALMVVVFLPLALYFYNSHNFIWFVSIVGGVFLALESILVVLMRHRLKPVGYWGRFIILVFLGGILYEIVKVV
ncbi:MAG: hypothetical protein CO020_00880 [Candidatus Colwellbacteria bacterium CG_4_9_14_0_2_um_filter_50_12]|uniref:Amino acid transporter transmembrane domain-containing protein n=1 Tax=Candidatus Colwellbacteria bacterium CG_4_9_14_0_2_um_filter_50_12 TaxID=1974538 RepID=A0A2M8G165_9BACT|nr:MAG: hypothetical protein CO020_00880 [Candidatus Colwellbacteria bacterium CG_4_9_14_0_2_um_filter_50_12]